MKTTIKAISPKGKGMMPNDTCVLLEDQMWYVLDEKVNPSFVKRGEAEIKVEGNKIHFVKMTGTQQDFKKSYGSYKPQQYPSDRTEDIRAQMLTKAAINLVGIQNRYSDSKGDKEMLIKPTKENLLVVARTIQDVVETLKKELKGGDNSVSG